MARNIPLFIAFRLLFNARFYYPVFAVLQLDYGLTLAQFAILNFVWAVTIVVLEVPSGALADRWGRKNMIVLASALMIAEMTLIAFVPLGASPLLFWIWVLNRILSGAAEASASGADEALAYDSIPKSEQESRWPKVLVRLMTCSSIAFIIAMLTGGAVYDVEFLNGLLGTNFEKSTVIRFPIYLTFITALITLPVTLFMKEPEKNTASEHENIWKSIGKTARWILGTPLVMMIILLALVHDTLVRLILTMNSEYYRLIGIPDSAFGIIGASVAALGIITPKIARKMVSSGNMTRNYIWVSVLIFIGLLGIAQAWYHYGVIVILFFSAGFGMLNFFTSHYLNSQVDSSHRATVLSFKGLALNIGFGMISLLYAGLLKGVDDDFKASLAWFPGTFLVALIPVIIYGWAKVRKRHKS